MLKSHPGLLAAFVCLALAACARSEPGSSRASAPSSQGTAPASPPTRMAQRLALTGAGPGLHGEVQLLVDSRLSAADLQNGDGYPAEEPLLARSVLQLVDAQGRTRDELTLHPAADFRLQHFGETDALLVTEHIHCEAGRFCGWPTRLLGIGSSKFTPIRALGAAGNEPDIEVMASFASRWAILPRGASGAFELVSQAEIPTSGTWVERRYFYEAGRWRYSERQTPAGDTEFAATPGNWHGALD